MNANWDAILFDMDGTLIDINMKEFLNEYFGLWQKAVEKFTSKPGDFVNNLIVATDQMVKNTDPNLTNEDVFWQTFSKFGWDDQVYKPVSTKFYENEFQSLDYLITQRPVMIELVEKINGKTKLALATNSVFPKKAILSRLTWGGFKEEYFDFVACYEEMHFCKPRPEYFLEIAKDLGVHPERCLVVGDDPQLDLVAHKQGMETFFLDTYDGQNAEWEGEAIHVVSEEDRIRGREVADHYGDISDLEQFIMAGLEK
ncbi:MAG: HAD family hydrolase [Firmicutes bacterium]|nr:HAD family hydrolase [Bacillota bacterium]MDD4263021.1 HAD family hydrolase [Bacillota bacterium]MDD4693260.1 HAD family hydrolase [Bacillota bacterium]